MGLRGRVWSGGLDQTDGSRLSPLWECQHFAASTLGMSALPNLNNHPPFLWWACFEWWTGSNGRGGLDKRDEWGSKGVNFWLNGFPSRLSPLWECQHFVGSTSGMSALPNLKKHPPFLWWACFEWWTGSKGCGALDKRDEWGSKGVNFWLKGFPPPFLPLSGPDFGPRR